LFALSGYTLITVLAILWIILLIHGLYLLSDDFGEQETHSPSDQDSFDCEEESETSQDENYLNDEEEYETPKDEKDEIND